MISRWFILGLDVQNSVRTELLSRAVVAPTSGCSLPHATLVWANQLSCAVALSLSLSSFRLATILPFSCSTPQRKNDMRAFDNDLPVLDRLIWARAALVGQRCCVGTTFGPAPFWRTLLFAFRSYGLG